MPTLRVNEVGGGKMKKLKGFILIILSFLLLSLFSLVVNPLSNILFNILSGISGPLFWIFNTK